MLKSFEKSIKKFFDGLISNNIEPILIKEPLDKIKLVDGSRILLLRQDMIGDLLVSVPMIHALRSTFPTIDIDILLSSKNYTAKRSVDDYVNNFYIYNKKLIHTILLIRNLRKRNYDMVIDLFDNPSTTSAYLIKLINPLYSLGFKKDNFRNCTHIVPLPDKRKFHIVERLANLLYPFGISPAKSDLIISFKLNSDETNYAKNLIKKSDRKTLGINLAGSYRAKFWGVDNYTDLINRFQSKFPDYEVIIFSMPEYEVELIRILANTNAQKAPQANSFVQFASYISVCDLILTPDTSAVHLAAAFKVPCVSLHIWHDNENTGMPWSAYNSPQRFITTSSDSLSNIPVDKVLDAISELIANGEKL